MPTPFTLNSITTFPNGQQILVVEYPEGFPDYDDSVGFLWFSTDDLSDADNKIQFPGDRGFHATADEAIQDAHQWLC